MNGLSLRNLGMASKQNLPQKRLRNLDSRLGKGNPFNAHCFRVFIPFPIYILRYSKGAGILGDINHETVYLNLPIYFGLSISTSLELLPFQCDLNRFHLLELGTGAYLFFCGCYDLAFGKNHYFVYLFAQGIAFFIMGFGYVGTFVPNS